MSLTQAALALLIVSYSAVAKEGRPIDHTQVHSHYCLLCVNVLVFRFAIREVDSFALDYCINAFVKHVTIVQRYC